MLNTYLINIQIFLAYYLIKINRLFTHVKNNTLVQIKNLDFGHAISQLQGLFVGLLRIWTIPIVLLLSMASGFTTYYGLANFITPWIALVITIAVQSIIVICSFELAGIHWKANKIRYLSVVLSLLIALAASVSFSYFKFYEISEHDNMRISRLTGLKIEIKHYLDEVVVVKNQILDKQRQELAVASKDVSQAYFGTHPDIASEYRNQVGQGPFWKHFNQLYAEKKQATDKLNQQMLLLDDTIRKLQNDLNNLDTSEAAEDNYKKMVNSFQEVQLQVNQLPALTDKPFPAAPLLMSYQQFIQNIKPSFSMWQGFSAFAFICAAMVDFFTVLLSYRLEFSSPGPLNAHEEELVFECLREFSEFKINKNDELQIVIEKTALEKAQRYSDWSRMFAVGLLLNRGFLRKLDERTVEFAPSLYPLVADKMAKKLRELKAAQAELTPDHYE